IENIEWTEWANRAIGETGYCVYSIPLLLTPCRSRGLLVLILFATVLPFRLLSSDCDGPSRIGVPHFPASSGLRSDPNHCASTRIAVVVLPYNRDAPSCETFGSEGRDQVIIAKSCESPRQAKYTKKTVRKSNHPHKLHTSIGSTRETVRLHTQLNVILNRRSSIRPSTKCKVGLTPSYDLI
ncbi:hypothetical protein ASPACDRAFT_1880129, partial [Aspergillus aculeatus ATCC 16872]